jgi:transcriptional regulator with PAS, ATPase and Fis domain
VLCDDEILPEHLSEEIRTPVGVVTSNPEGLNLRERVGAMEFELITLALERTEGNLTRAAELLGLSRFGLQKMLKRFAGRLGQTPGPKPAAELSGLR